MRGVREDASRWAEIDVSLLFADVRGSTAIAERMKPAEFSAVMNRFFRSGSEVLIDSDALIDRLVGDEVIGLYLPAVVTDHPRAAIEAARNLLVATGHTEPNGPWLPVGIRIHSDTAFVGSVGDASVADFTAMGDTVNVTARLASAASAERPSSRRSPGREAASTACRPRAASWSSRAGRLRSTYASCASSRPGSEV